MDNGVLMYILNKQWENRSGGPMPQWMMKENARINSLDKKSEVVGETKMVQK